MRMLQQEVPLCFGEYATQVANSLTCKSTEQVRGGGGGARAESTVRSTYRTKVGGKSYLMTVTWCRSIGGAGLSLQVTRTDMSSRDEEVRADVLSMDGERRKERRRDGGAAEATFWVFGDKRKGSKELKWEGAMAVWDMTGAKYEGGGAEPKGGYYFAVVVVGEEGKEVVVLSLGDRAASEMRVMGRREEVVVAVAGRWRGRGGVFVVRGARLSADAAATLHDISIECDWCAAEPRLAVRIDRRTVMCVRKLRWKFRGNHTVLVDGAPFELFWDVHNWLFLSSSDVTTTAAIFLFQSSSSCSSDRSFSSLASSLFQWQHHSSTSLQSSSSSCSCSSSSLKDITNNNNSAVSLLLYACK